MHMSTGGGGPRESVSGGAPLRSGGAVSHAWHPSSRDCQPCEEDLVAIDSQNVAQIREANGRIKRSAEAKATFMRQSGYPHGRPGYVVDHIAPLACGGADAVEHAVADDRGGEGEGSRRARRLSMIAGANHEDVGVAEPLKPRTIAMTRSERK